MITVHVLYGIDFTQTTKLLKLHSGCIRCVRAHMHTVPKAAPPAAAMVADAAEADDSDSEEEEEGDLDGDIPGFIVPDDHVEYEEGSSDESSSSSSDGELGVRSTPSDEEWIDEMGWAPKRRRLRKISSMDEDDDA